MAFTAILDMDTRLMLKVQEEDGLSFNCLLERHRTPVVLYLTRMVHNPAIAEELAQDVFVRVYRSRHTYEPTAKFTTWLFRITTNVAFNHFRDSRHYTHHVSLDRESLHSAKRECSDRRPTIEQRMVNEARNQEIRDAIAALPPKQRAAVLMHKYEEMDYAQIAKVLGLSPSAVKALMFRAYESLRARLAHLDANK